MDKIDAFIKAYEETKQTVLRPYQKMILKAMLSSKQQIVIIKRRIR